MRLLALLGALLLARPARGAASARLERWVRAGLQSLQWEQLERCLRRSSSVSEAECRRLAYLPPSSVAVYASEPRAAAGPSDKVLAVLPDSSSGMLSSEQQAGLSTGRTLNRREGLHRYQRPPHGSAAHDAVLVLDPSPEENFGHPVVLFYVDVNVTKKRCSQLDGIYLGAECLTLALKGRCQNQLKRRQTGPERFLGNSRLSGGGRGGPSGGRLLEQAIRGLCEVHFLPLVVAVGDRNRTQRLRCVEHSEFARCPQLLPMTSTTFPVSSCELNKNTRRCHQQLLATHLSCRLYQTCDHAVLLSGGWRQQVTFQRHAQNLLGFYRMLLNNGFHKDHIKTFFAGGGQLPEDIEGVYSATEKAVIRNHVSYICRKQHCADTLVLYLNSPTRNDGAMLLWDANLNGIADLKERYSVNELLTDLAGCKATRVLLFVDQSYSGVLSKRLRGSQKHFNVVLIRSPVRQTFPLQNQRLNQAWDDSNWSFISPTTCLLDHLSKGGGTSHLFELWAGLLNVTLAGAPCNATPPLTDIELRREYQGCQNLPTARWHQKPQRSH